MSALGQEGCAYMRVLFLFPLGIALLYFKLYGEVMNRLLEEQRYQAYLDFERRSDSEQSPSPFLTDRETAELTLAVAVPFALAAFTNERVETGVRPAPEAGQEPEPQTPDVPDTIDGFERVDLLALMHQQHSLARAAIMFADNNLN
jgi:hypothetical protein